MFYLLYKELLKITEYKNNISMGPEFWLHKFFWFRDPEILKQNN